MESFIATAQRSSEIADAAAQHPEKNRVLTGERPTGPLHLGHYFGTIHELVRSVLRHGNEKARAVAEVALAEVREAMGTVY